CAALLLIKPRCFLDEVCDRVSCGDGVQLFDGLSAKRDTHSRSCARNNHSQEAAKYDMLCSLVKTWENKMSVFFRGALVAAVMGIVSIVPAAAQTLREGTAV